MPTLIRDLLHFEEVEEVIKIRQDEKAKEYVEKYVISDSLRNNLAYMFEILAGATHKSFKCYWQLRHRKKPLLGICLGIVRASRVSSIG